MAYSGTVGTTVINVQTYIDHGARRAGKLAEELTSEQQISARESLYYLLSNLINMGIQYWCISKKIYGVQPDKAVYDLPVGGNDVLQALYRRMNRPTPSATGGYTASSGVAANAFDSNIVPKRQHCGQLRHGQHGLCRLDWRDARGHRRV